MMPDGRNAMYIFSYDITDDKERRRVSKILDGYGFRVQKSIYVCWISPSLAKRACDKLNGLGLSTGFVLSWHVPDNSSCTSLGQAPEEIKTNPVSAIVI